MGLFADLAEQVEPQQQQQQQQPQKASLLTDLAQQANPSYEPLAAPQPEGLNLLRPGIELVKGFAGGIEQAIGTMGALVKWAVESPFVKTADPGAAITDIATRWGPDWMQTFAKKMQHDNTKTIELADKWADWWEEQANTGWEAPDAEVSAAKWSEMPISKAAQAIGTGAPSFLTAIAASVLTKSPQVGLTILATQAGAGQHRKQRKAGVGIDMANAIAMLTAAWEYGTEKIPFEFIMKGGNKNE